MKRRRALKNMGLLTGGLLLFPSCDFSEEKITIILRQLQIPESQQVLLEEIVATIIPEGDLPGARSLNVQNFLWGIVGECMTDEDQQSYLIGLQEFELKFNQADGQIFVALSENERVKILIDLTKKKLKEDDLQEFIQTTKKLTIQGYMMSQFIMTEIMPYQLIPGGYATCETIDPNKRINTNA
jgi:hypothetical protein